MVLGKHGRGVQHVLFGPIAKGLVRLGVSANAVTIAGTLITTVLALTLVPMGHHIWGALLLGLMVATDSVDGIMARETGTAGPFGAFLDSTLDRVADAAIFAGVLLWFLFHTDGGWQVVGISAALGCLAFGSMVSYARAKAESLGVQASVGIAERADRVIVVLVAMFATGVGAPAYVLAIALIVIAAASLFTVFQRINAVRHGLAARVAGEPTSDQPAAGH